MRFAIKSRVLAGAAAGGGAALLAATLSLHAAAAQTVTPPASAQGTAQTNTRQTPFQAFIADIAGKLHVKPADLGAAIAGAEKDAVQARVAAGKLTQAQADQLIKRIDQQGPGALLRVLGERARAARAGRGHAGPAGEQVIAAVAQVTGYTPRQVRDQLRDGKTLLDIGASKGKSQADLTAAIQASIKQRLDTEVANKRITADQETRLFARASAGIDKLLTRTFGQGKRS